MPLVISTCFVQSLAAAEFKVASPGGKVEATITTDKDGHLTFAVDAKAGAVVLPSPIGLVLDGVDLGAAAQIGNRTAREIEETYPVMGFHAQAVNHCRELSLAVRSGEGKPDWHLDVRAFDDGVAYRYRIPENGGERTITGETSSWTFPTGGTIWFQDSASRNYEKSFTASALDALPQEKPIMSDGAIQLPGKLGYVVPTEANVLHYSDMVLQPDGPARFKALFPNDPQGWKVKGEIVSPWRVTLYSEDLNGLVNSDLLRNLCPPPDPEVARAEWIRPGRAAWHWMVTGSPKVEEQHQWVDWTRQLGWEYYIVDDGWVTWRAEGKDQWALLKEIVDYAATQNVKIIAWVHTKEVTNPDARSAYFKRAQAIGLAGLKVDFMGPPSAQCMRWHDETLREAAAAHLLIDFHGCVKPSGRERTWPNELTREGIRGREAGKTGGLHDSTVPFTRYVHGHADYTPTDWRESKLRGNSYAHELAQAVVYTSPLLCFSGAPENYLENEAADVLKAVPATWDETIVLPGSAIGEVAAYARRKGEEWFIGIINGSTPRKLEIPLGFLAAGSWKGDLLADDLEKNDAWARQKRNVTNAEVLKLDLRSDGGFVARLTR